jgi:predicted aminopeptidase
VAAATKGDCKHSLAIERRLVQLEGVSTSEVRPLRPAPRTRALRRSVHVALAMAATLAAALTVGCRPFYIARIGVQQLRYMSRATPIEEEIERSDDPEKRRKLELVLQAREFARANGLDPGGSYLKVSNTEGLSAGYVVTAAYQDRLEPYDWSYPVIGKIPYRGYFKREDADQFAGEMEDAGYDTYVFPAAGYSTLGWFDDPLPAPLLRFDDVTLVDVVIHELVHQNVYVAGEIAFNETLASAVSKQLTPGFFVARGDPINAIVAEGQHRLWLGQSDLFGEYAERLQRYFAETANGDRGALLAGRTAIYKELESRLIGLQPSDAPDLETGPILNNAVFLALWRYRKSASLIERYLATFPDVPSAIADLREHAKEDGDPYALIAVRLRSAACCSGKTAVSSLRHTLRPWRRGRGRAAENIDTNEEGS